MVVGVGSIRLREENQESDIRDQRAEGKFTVES
jgi:hypothetical protein